MRIKKSPGEVLKVNFHTYIDQLSDDYKTFTTFNTSDYLSSNYNITKDQYFSLIYNGTIEFPECHKDGCSNKVKFISPMRGFTKYCSKSCQISDQQLNFLLEGKHISQSNPTKYKEFQMKGTETGLSKAKEQSRVVLHNMALNGNHPFQNIRTKSLSNRNQFINKNKGLECYFYIASNFDLYPNHFKIGITTYGSNRIQIPINRRYNDGDKIFYKSIHILLKGDCELIANIEYNLKIQLYDSSNLTSEWIHINKLHKFFILYKNILKDDQRLSI